MRVHAIVFAAVVLATAVTANNHSTLQHRMVPMQHNAKVSPLVRRVAEERLPTYEEATAQNSPPKKKSKLLKFGKYGLAAAGGALAYKMFGGHNAEQPQE